MMGKMSHNTKSFIAVFSGFTAVFLALSIFCFILAPKDLKGLEVGPAFPSSFEPDETEAIEAMLENNPFDADFAKLVNDFSYKTASQLLSDGGQNSAFSPVALYYALATTGSGARSHTQSEIYSLLGAETTKQLGEAAGTLYRLLYSDNSFTKTRISNSIWLDDSASYHHETKDKKMLEFKEKFIYTARDYFYSTLFSVDMEDPETAISMQKWVSQYTGGLIDAPMNIDPDTLMSIFSTIHFSDEWVTKFNESLTAPDVFIAADGSSVEASFMNAPSRTAPFYKGSNFSRASLDLVGGSKMVFILPDEGVNASDLLATQASAQALFEGTGEAVPVTFKIPKFSYDSAFDLKEQLQALGVNKIFTPKADFSEMTNKSVMVSNISQKTHVAIDEKGVQAASFVQTDITPTAGPNDGAEQMILNRPFVYSIVSEEGIPLFIGVCQNPAA